MKPKANNKSQKSNKRLSDAEWHAELVKRLVQRVRVRYQKSPKFVRHLITAFVEQDTNVLKYISHDQIDPNTQQLTCAISNYLFDEKVPAISSIYSTALISESALDALTVFKNEIYDADAELRELFENRTELRLREVKRTSNENTLGSLFTPEQLEKLKTQRK